MKLRVEGLKSKTIVIAEKLRGDKRVTLCVIMHAAKADVDFAVFNSDKIGDKVYDSLTGAIKHYSSI